MSTKVISNKMLQMLAILIALAFISISPLITDGKVLAAESPANDDVNNNYVNENDVSEDQIDDDEGLKTDNEKKDSGDMEEKSDKNDTKSDPDPDDKEDVDADQDEDRDIDNEDADDDQDGDRFPGTYRSAISDLKDAHPSWNFKPVRTGVSWKTALDAEDVGGRTLVEPSDPKAQRESSSRTYDGRWYPANRKTIAHYMDPRNFLNEKDIFQFLVQTYEDGAQNEDTVSDVIDGSFMEDRSPGGKYESYAECITKAGKKAGVNPNVLAAMIIMEQGWKGSSLVSGEKKGYKGYYNFFNIGAWTTDSMTSSERGLWYAKGEGEGNDSYQRPWNSPYKAIVGGATFYQENYISEQQNTYYTKKFNVMNGADSVGKHEYMTNVSGALSEGKLLRRAYEDHSDMSLTFEIPVYEDMPKKTCKLP